MNNYVWNDKKVLILVDDFNYSIDVGRYVFEWFLLGKKIGVC